MQADDGDGGTIRTINGESPFAFPCFLKEFITPSN